MREGVDADKHIGAGQARIDPGQTQKAWPARIAAAERRLDGISERRPTHRAVASVRTVEIEPEDFVRCWSPYVVLAVKRVNDVSADTLDREAGARGVAVDSVTRAAVADHDQLRDAGCHIGRRQRVERHANRQRAGKRNHRQVVIDRRMSEAREVRMRSPTRGCNLYSGVRIHVEFDGHDSVFSVAAAVVVEIDTMRVDCRPRAKERATPRINFDTANAGKRRGGTVRIDAIGGRVGRSAVGIAGDNDGVKIASAGQC